MAKLSSTRVYGNLIVDNNTTLSGSLIANSITSETSLLIEGDTNIEGSLTVDGLLTAGIDFVTSCPTGANTIGFKVYTGSVDCATKFSGWIYFVEED